MLNSYKTVMIAVFAIGGLAWLIWLALPPQSDPQPPTVVVTAVPITPTASITAEVQPSVVSTPVAATRVATYTVTPSATAMPSVTSMISATPGIEPSSLPTPVVTPTEVKAMVVSPEPTVTLAPTPDPQLPEPPVEILKDVPDFSTIHDVKERKRKFFSFLAPIVMSENEYIIEKRKRLLAIQKQDTVSESDQAFMLSLAKTYRVKNVDETQALLDELLIKVNRVPVSLALAQSANESAWALSRFAVEGNNLFGQWCFKVGCGIVPEGRPEGETYEVTKFDSPAKSVRSYLLNLNRHHAYRPLRELRQLKLADAEHFNGLDLADGLINYSTRREAYVKEIKAMIRHNNLTIYDN